MNAALELAVADTDAIIDFTACIKIAVVHANLVLRGMSCLHILAQVDADIAADLIRPARAIISGDGNRWYLRGEGGAIYATFGILRHRSPQICEWGIGCNLATFVSRSDTPNEDRAERK